MRYLSWFIRFVIFLAILFFALKNTQKVDVAFYNDYVLANVPLIVVMLVAFAVGALFALVVLIPSNLRRRRELARMQRQLDRINQAAQLARNQNAPLSPDAVAPLAPL